MYEEKLIKMDVHLKAEQGRFTELFNSKFRSIEEELFTYKNRIAECSLLKSQFDIFLEKQQQFENMFVNEYKTEVISQISKMREEFLEHNQELSQSVSYMRRTFDQTLMPQFEVMRE